jgi:hypothetical protein
MSEFVLENEELPMDEPNTQQYFKNIKELKIGGGRWKQDSEALRMYDSDGNVVIYLGEDT